MSVRLQLGARLYRHCFRRHLQAPISGRLLPVAPPKLHAVDHSSCTRSTIVSEDVNGLHIECKRAIKRSAISQGIPVGIPAKNPNRH